MLSAHEHESYGSLLVCVCVCYHSSASLRRVCDKLNFHVLAKSLLSLQGFQRGDLAKKLSFPEL